MINVGEQLVSSYLRYIRGCDFTQMNVYTVGVQGEIDVLGVDLKRRRAYICEVAVHLTTGINYVGKDNKPNNVAKLTDKFSRDIEYAEKYLADYERHYMLWSPIVKKTTGKAMYNQIEHLKEIGANIRTKHGVELEFIVNEKFLAAFEELRSYAGAQRPEMQCPLMRLLQVEAYLKKHVHKIAAAAADAAGLSIAPIRTRPAPGTRTASSRNVGKAAGTR